MLLHRLRGGDHSTTDQAAYGWLVIGQSVGVGLAYASSVCDMNSASAVAVGA